MTRALPWRAGRGWDSSDRSARPTEARHRSGMFLARPRWRSDTVAARNINVRLAPSAPAHQWTACDDAGFTLVELLMAAVTAALLFAGFSLSLHGGRVVWARTMDGLENLSRQRATLDHLAQDLTHAVVLPVEEDAPPSARFDAQHLQLYTVESPSTEDRLGRLWQIEYLVEDAPDGRALVRRARPFDSAATSGITQRLLTGVERISFRYGDRDPDAPAGITWSSVWEDEETLPPYVEVSMQAPGRMPIRHLLRIPAGT